MAKKRIGLDAAWSEAVIRVWKESDPAFRKKLVSDPTAALRELGADVPDDVDIVIVENTPKRLHFVIPPKPDALRELRDQATKELYQACPGTVCATCSSGEAQ